MAECDSTQGLRAPEYWTDWRWQLQCPRDGLAKMVAKVHSFAMPTINADTHPVMRNYHRPDDEKRRIVILREDDFGAWLEAPSERSMEFMRQCAPEDLVVTA